MFRFENIEYLYALPALILLWALLQMAVRRNRKTAAILGDSVFRNYMLPDWSLALLKRRNALIIALSALFLLALANPQVGTKKEEVEARSADVFILLDISNSMLATDVAPDRMARARRIAGNVIRALGTERVGLITFAGNAYLHMPLTSDYRAALSFLQSVSPSTAGTQGTAIAEAINLALQSYDKKQEAHPVMVLVSDGENHEGGMEAAQQGLVEKGVLLFTIGVGTEEGGPIPLPDESGGFLRDENGQLVTTRFQPGLLDELAGEAGGSYFPYTMGEDIAREIRGKVARLDKIALARRSFSEYESYYQIPLGVALVLLCLAWFWTPKNVKL